MGYYYYCKTCDTFYSNKIFMKSNCECNKCAEKKKASKNDDIIRDCGEENE